MSSHRDGLIGFLSGGVFGLVSLVVGHPFDTLKTKMQAQKGYTTGSAFSALMHTVKSDGILALYRGCIPPLLGTFFLRSVQFGGYELVYSMTTPKDKNTKVPQIFGIDARIIYGGCAGGLARGIVECPLDVAKITRQTGTSWKFTELGRGFWINIARNIPLLTFFFGFQELTKPIPLPSYISREFLNGSICATFAWWAIFPLDVIKSRKQASRGIGQSSISIAKEIYTKHGFVGFYRGFLPGTLRSLFANGLSFYAYNKSKAFLQKHI